ncbi:hypothetical protein KM043_013217 [Ampulex compressa]|nr:hypothetical protein KM043_013217 [Ampulex compressa]
MADAYSTAYLNLAELHVKGVFGKYPRGLSLDRILLSEKGGKPPKNPESVPGLHPLGFNSSYQIQRKA